MGFNEELLGGVGQFFEYILLFYKDNYYIWMGLNGVEIWLWPRQQESNLYFTLRRHTFYPLNYGEVSERCMGIRLWYGHEYCCVQ